MNTYGIRTPHTVSKIEWGTRTTSTCIRAFRLAYQPAYLILSSRPSEISKGKWEQRWTIRSLCGNWWAARGTSPSMIFTLSVNHDGQKKKTLCRTRHTWTTIVYNCKTAGSGRLTGTYRLWFVFDSTLSFDLDCVTSWKNTFCNKDVDYCPQTNVQCMAAKMNKSLARHDIPS